MSKTASKFKEFSKGLLKENPVFVLALGLCPTLGVTTLVSNGIGMGLATTFVLLASNILISLLKDFIPEKVRIPSYIVVIASFVTIVDLTMAAYLPSLHASLGIFIPLIVVNCVILGRAESFASNNNVTNSILDALGMGLGFTLALTAIAFIRELLGNGTVQLFPVYIDNLFGTGMNIAFDGVLKIPGLFEEKIMIFAMPAGALIVMGLLQALLNWVNEKKRTGR